MLSNNQQNRVYSWERRYIAHKDTTLVPYDMAEPIISYVWENEGLKYPPLLKPLDKRNKRVIACANRTEIFLPERVETWIILHELSHSMTCEFDGLSNLHGALFLGIYMGLLNRYLKIEYKYMTDSADSMGLKFKLDARPVFL
jgi:hypothetical protein